MSHNEKKQDKLPVRSTPRAKIEMEHITSTPMSFTTPKKRHPDSNIAMPSDEGVEKGREFSEENIL